MMPQTLKDFFRHFPFASEIVKFYVYPKVVLFPVRAETDGLLSQLPKDACET